MWITIEQTNITHAHNKLSVKPVLQVESLREEIDGRSGLYLKNVGLGPAEVVKITIIAGNRTFNYTEAEDRLKFIRDFLNMNSNCLSESKPNPGFYIKSSDTEPIIITSQNSSPNMCHHKAFLALQGKLVKFIIDYRSIYSDDFKKEQTLKIDIDDPSTAVNSP